MAAGMFVVGCGVKRPAGEMVDVEFQAARNSIANTRVTFRSMETHCIERNCDELVLFPSTGGKCIMCYGRARSPYKLTYRRRRVTSPHRKIARMSDDVAKQIRTLYESGRTMRVIAKQFGVGESTISDVVHRRTWVTRREAA